MLGRGLLCLTLSLPCAAQSIPVSHHASPALLSDNTRAQFEQMMDGTQRSWDSSAKLLRASGFIPGKAYPGNYKEDPHYFENCCYTVRSTASYALNLLYRDAPGDRERAAQALDGVLSNQYEKPGVRWFGTFKRTPEEPTPGPDAVMWRDYDPNWREFIGTVFMMILVEYPDRIPQELAQRLYRSIDLAVEGEAAEQRLVPAYTNPSLMFGILWDFASEHDRRLDWRMQSGDWIESVYRLFRQYDAFSEFNSPTYNSVDFYALALWREYGSTERIRMQGSAMEASLWEEVGTFFQPELHTLSGPYDRSYGMTNTGDGFLQLLHYARNPNGTPLNLDPSKLPPGFSVQMEILGAVVPSEVIGHLQTFQGEHLVRKQITDQRVATAWIGKNVCFGAEATNKTRDVGHNSQFHPVTIQWRTPSGDLGWVRVVGSPMIDATADKQGISISTDGTIRLRIHAKGLDPDMLKQTLWNMPGLTIHVVSDAQSVFSVEQADPKTLDPAMRGDDGVDVIYPGVTNMRLDITAASGQ
jgi:hypothetical protein